MSTSSSTSSSNQSRFVLYAMMAGTFGALSGAVGKLSVTDELTLGVLFRVLFFASNGLFTAQMWRYYLKALSLGPTPTCQILNTGTNFAVSATLGLWLFGETVNALWMAGAVCVAVGLALIVSDPQAPVSN